MPTKAPARVRITLPTDATGSRDIYVDGGDERQNMTTDSEILARVQASAHEGFKTELDDVPEHLWSAVCESNRELQLTRWRNSGWDVASVECDKGCCCLDRLTPPSKEPEPLTPYPCTRGVVHVILASYREQNPAQVEED